MIWILLLIGAVVLLSSNKPAPPVETPVSTNVTSPVTYSIQPEVPGYKFNETTHKYDPVPSTPLAPVVIGYTPPPGYTGPVNGPFTWVGVGEPPNGEHVVKGNPVTQS